MILIFYFILIIVSLIQANLDNVASSRNVLVIVFTNSNSKFDENKFNSFDKFLIEQKNEHNLNVSIVSLSRNWSDLDGAWTIFPIIKDLYDKYSTNYQNFLFCEADSRVNLSKFETYVLNNLDNSKPIFVGHGLFDEEATIIHHFSFHENPRQFHYPDPAACFLLNSKLIEILAKQEPISENDFSIDIKHEFAKFIFNNGNGYRLTENKHFCNYNDDKKCVTWFNWSSPNCQKEHKVNNDNVVFGVKTYSGYHNERVPFIKRTWFEDTNGMNVLFFSDKIDPSIPTIDAGANTESGHCSKTFSIFEYYMKNLSSKYDILVVCDDDTLFNVQRLFDLISCYMDTDSFIIGEKYGFAANAYGYNYPTGGSGMIFNRNAVKYILSNCQCPNVNTPDDMYIGACIKHSNIEFVHSNLLHQARPYDYSKDYLNHQNPISFHKYWNCDPIEVYDKWLKKQQQQQQSERNEL